jgi:hypothetical protein
VKYMLLIYNNPATYQGWSEAERDELFGEVDVIMKELTASGELVGGEALADASSTKTVRVRDGVPETTDGPYAEAKEQLAGYLMVDCASPKRAAISAARWPDARYFAMEVRQVPGVLSGGSISGDVPLRRAYRRLTARVTPATIVVARIQPAAINPYDSHW